MKFFRIHKYRCVIQIGTVLLLPSCVQSNRAKHGLLSHTKCDAVSRATVCNDLVRRHEAKLIDIPFPIPSTPMQQFHHVDGDTMVLGYKTSLSAREVHLFYYQEMERLGWLCVKKFSGHEFLLDFEKPDRICIVSIRPEPMVTDIIIYTGYRECDVVGMQSPLSDSASISAD